MGINCFPTKEIFLESCNNLNLNFLCYVCYCPQTKLQEGNVFFYTCLSVILFTGGGVHPSGQGGVPPLADTPQEDTPRKTHTAPRQTPPR